ncbi:hypothetical protein ACPPVT_12895 [Angustibacter sp. McL0619]|uniref:hypothetical protein n=1 Tax=Angustibacter sp. McL0619 TaxID=3415676 RepID=UPI003CECA6B7
MTAPGAGDREQVGSAADEAARLVDALQGWWREREPERDPDPNREATTAAHEPSSSCRYCPLCRLMSTAQSRRPELMHHLLVTAESVVGLLRELSRPDEAETATPDPAAQQGAGVRTVSIPVEPDDEPADEPGGH